jgi:hypothetical protein
MGGQRDGELGKWGNREIGKDFRFRIADFGFKRISYAFVF